MIRALAGLLLAALLFLQLCVTAAFLLALLLR